jgi:hypothetical protein
MKTVFHQQRYRLKHIYFDPFPLHMVMKLWKLLRSNAWVMDNGTILWTNGRIPKHDISLCKYQTLDLYMILCHLSYINSVFDAGDMSKEQKQQRQCSVLSNNRLLELRGLYGKSCKYIYNPLLPLCFFSLLWLSNTLVHGNVVFRETRIMIKNLMH